MPTVIVCLIAGIKFIASCGRPRRRATQSKDHRHNQCTLLRRGPLGGAIEIAA
jgi:hypothetical protein